MKKIAGKIIIYKYLRLIGLGLLGVFVGLNIILLYSLKYYWKL